MATSVRPTSINLDSGRVYRSDLNYPQKLEDLESQNLTIVECGSMAQAEMALRSLSSSEVVLIHGRKMEGDFYGSGSLKNNDKVYYTAE